VATNVRKLLLKEHWPFLGSLVVQEEKVMFAGDWLGSVLTVSIGTFLILLLG